MCQQAVTEENRAASITPIIKSSMPWRVRTIVILSDYRLSVSFAEGFIGIIDTASLIASPIAGVFEQLRAPDLFAQGRVGYDAVTWPGKPDLALDTMYAEIKASVLTCPAPDRERRYRV